MNDSTNHDPLSVAGESNFGDLPGPSPEELTEIEREVVQTEEESPSRKENLTGDELFMRTFRYPVLPHETVVELAKQVKSGDEKAREKLILHNMRLVMSIGKKYRGYGLDDHDLYQEGVIGLMKAIEKYDPLLGWRFSTYATWWIKQSIRRALDDKGADIRLPEHVGMRRRKIKRIASELTASLGRKPTVEEIKKKSGFSLTDIEDSFKMTGTVVFSIHETIEHKDGETERGDTLPDPHSIDPAELLERKEARMQLDDRIGSLLRALPTLSVNDRDIEIFKASYGLNGSIVQINLPLEYVAKQFDLTRERVRQIIAGIWSKLERRNPEWLSVLRALEIRGDKCVRVDASRHKELQKKKLVISEARRRQGWHFRASPAFVKWQPNESDQKNPARACLAFVGMAYEIQVSDILVLKPKKLAKWTQYLSVYLMSKVLKLDNIEIAAHAPPVKPSLVRDMCRDVESLIKSDAFIYEDVEGLMAHFQKAMSLQ
jgi:RNA polymerase primary sigma factor